MIDVPILVKDALREGSYTKNYRFKVLEEPEQPAGYYEIARLAEAEKFTMPVSTGYKIVGEAPSSYTGITTWEDDEPMEWLTPPTTSPYTEFSGYFTAGDVISVSGFSDIVRVSVQQLYPRREGKEEIDIDNNNLVSESVNIDERMCSGDTIKFGLCEGSSLEFQYFGKDNITGRRIQAFVDVEYGANAPYTIPMGFFTVAKCSRQASTGIVKVTAYNKLQSDYLDAKVNDEIIEIAAAGEAGNSSVSFYYILKQLLEDYSIETYNVTQEWPDIPADMLSDDTLFSQWLSWHAGQVSEVYFPIYQLNSTSVYGYLHVAFARLSMGGYQGEDYYDRYLFNEDAAQYITQTTYASLGTDLDNRRVRNASDTSSYMTLREFLMNGGFYTFRASVSVTLDHQQEVLGGRLTEQNKSTYLTVLDADYMTDINYISQNSNVGLLIPYKVVINSSTSSIANITDFRTYFRQIHSDLGWEYKSFTLELPEMALQRITKAEAEQLSDVTLRDLQSAVYESVCQFGQLDRVTDLFSGVELNRSRLLPAETLYPANDLYPGGADASGFKSMYSKLWADEGNVHKWRNLIITFKSIEDGSTVDKTLQRTINADGTDDYNMSDNWIFRNLTWTSDQVAVYADAMVDKMRDISWFPFEMWCAGLPYVETGDEIEIPLGQDTYVSYILQRQLKGIQKLQDTYINGTLDIF